MLSTFWQVWVTVIVVGSMIGCGLLIQFTSRGMKKEETTENTGHEYDGIVELDNPMPRWWVIMFWGTIVFGFIYLGVYGLGNFKGLLKLEVNGEQVSWSSENQWKAEVEAFNKETAPLYAKFSATPVEELVNDEDALESGQRLFKSNCSVCHGSNAKGSTGFPNLTDKDWLYGGSADDIKQTISNGRQGVMPTHAHLGDDMVADLTQYVRGLSGLSHDQAQADKAKDTFASTCSVCHGADGKGNTMLGAPNLTDDVWLYGGSTKQIEFTIKNGRSGKMPAHHEILGDNADAKIHLLATYVYSLSLDKK